MELQLIVLLLFKSIVLLLPLTVAYLAFRQLSISDTSNAWLYAVVGLLAVFTAAGLTPWAFASGHSGWFFFVMALLTPLLWGLLLFICGDGRESAYEPSDVRYLRQVSSAIVKTFWKFTQFVHDQQSFDRPEQPKLATLILENPVLPQMPSPQFRHHTRPPILAEEKKSVLRIARDMRGKRDSAERRPKMLPSPEMVTPAIPKTTFTTKRAAAAQPLQGDIPHLPFLIRPGTPS